MANKIWILLTDGVGIRNFGQTKFPKEILDHDLEATWWNMSEMPLNDNFAINEVSLQNPRINKLTPLFTRARKRLELNYWREKFKDEVYDSYKFPFNYKGPKNILRSIFTKFLIGIYSGKNGIKRIRMKIENLERGTDYYQSCFGQLKEDRPNIVFSTTQRSTKAIAPLLAARDLGIKTVSFIYSWDNVPKAMLVAESDFYFVWSDLMKRQLLNYYEWLEPNRVFVTGTPQFEPHYLKKRILRRNDFFEAYKLDLTKRYICYSGDDTTTSPLDHLYLRDLARTVEKLNEDNYNIGIIFRKAPVDATKRYDPVLKQFSNVITAINPLWKPYGKSWNLLLPQKEDFYLLSNICEHCELVVNVCSSMVFDFAIHNKPCIYINYEQPELRKGTRDIGQNYKYVHFRSMPSKNSVVWVEKASQFKEAIEFLMDDKTKTLGEVKQWLNIIAGEQPEKASSKIATTFKRLDECI